MTASVIPDNLKNRQQVLISPHLSAIPFSSAPLQLGVMASGSGTNLSAVAKAIADGQLNAEIKVLIYSKPTVSIG